ncbi:3-isopropylmalate dehydratase large subunit [Natronococcus sp. A-GB7]|uniref:3-isopropylmalate dehydratase large subunit n=1 Tax=Natronococcus sp. A-GB7 TaxID=3037649 RepID=UPI00241EE254|nr:3-isopropylmalate dehydratase large subunit [Natronococcus sp. A-GB7]MDG5820219.1 3-isopropylmalate dehydratase large subunit [Natronococcus sp. A-GB7]
MGTIAEQILQEATGTDVTPGETIKAPVDLAFGHDMTLPPAIDAFERLDVGTVFDPDRTVVIPDHLVPPPDEQSVELYAACEEFANRHDLEFYPQGEQGQEHVVLPEDGYIRPGEIVVGADSHSCTHGALGAYATGVGSTDLAFAMAFGWLWLRVPKTTRIDYTGTPARWVTGKDLVLATLAELGADGAVYHALEFGGSALADLPMDARFSIANMAVEAGAATGLVEPDDRTKRYVRDRVDEADRPCTYYTPTADATYANELTIDCGGLEPQVAVPEQPDNVVSVSTLEDVAIDQVVIGSCTNGRRRDMELAAAVLEDRPVADDVRLIVTPGSQAVKRTCLEEGWLETFLDAGATVESPGCGACFGKRTGVLGEDEVAISTTNRNFPGRMGHPTSAVYLANPAVAAASATTGTITAPGTLAGAAEVS